MSHENPQMPRNRKGPLHIIDAAMFSVAGFARLWQETAARLDILVLSLITIGLIAMGSTPWEIGIFIMLGLALLVVEALNTAIEEITDHLTSEWALWAKHAKDLGSLAAGLTIVIIGIYLGLLVGSKLFGWSA